MEIQDEIVIFLKSCDFPHPFFFFSSLFKCKLVLACFEWTYPPCPPLLGRRYWAGAPAGDPEDSVLVAVRALSLHQSISRRIWWFGVWHVFILS